MRVKDVQFGGSKCNELACSKQASPSSLTSEHRPWESYPILRDVKSLSPFYGENPLLRAKTGQKCPITGMWRLVGYTDRSSFPAATPGEFEILIEVGNTFPPVRSVSKGAFREFVH